MSRLLKTVLALTAAPVNARRRGHRAVAKKVDATRISRHESDGEVQWEMLSVPPTLLALHAGDDDLVTPAWSPGKEQACERSPARSSMPAVYSDLKLPFELWELVFDGLDDGYDIHSLARVCHGLKSVATDAIKRHANFTKLHRAATLDSYESMLSLLDRAESSPRISLAIRDLTIHYQIRWSTASNVPVPRILMDILKSLPNLRSLSLHISSDRLVLVCLRAGLLSVVHPHLRSFNTSLAYSSDIVRFLLQHPAIEDLSIPDFSIPDRLSIPNLSLSLSIPDQVLGVNISLPSLRILSCGLETFMRLGRASTLTHLHLRLYVPQTLETIGSLLGPQLISLRLGVLERLPDLHSPRVVWSPQDILTRFPRLAYIEVHMSEPDLLPHPIQWQQKRDKWLRTDRRTPLTVAWVLEEDAWGTLLDPRDTDIVRQLFEEVAFDVLRHWTPHIARIVYGDSGVPDSSVTLNASGEEVTRGDNSSLGEDYWKRV